MIFEVGNSLCSEDRGDGYEYGDGFGSGGGGGDGDGGTRLVNKDKK